MSPPSFGATCPPNIHAYAERNRRTANVNWNEPNATDNAGVPQLVRSGKMPGKEFDEGIHTIRYTATDAIGNIAECTFKVTVSGMRQ